MNRMLSLYLMSEKGLRVLEAVFSQYPELINRVIVGRDSGVENDFSDEIQSYCANHSIPCFDRTNISSNETEYSLAISWRWLIRDSDTQLIVIHDSLLPKYRGFNPLVTALINGDDEIGATALWANENYDCGDIIYQSSFDVDYPLRIADAICEMAKHYQVLSLRIAEALFNAQALPRIIQNEANASYSLWRDEGDYYLDWTLDCEILKRQIDAQGYPYQCSATGLKGKKILIASAAVVDDVDIVNRSPGKVIFVEDGCPIVVCGVGLLKVTEAVWDSDRKSLLPFNKIRTNFSHDPI